MGGIEDYIQAARRAGVDSPRARELAARLTPAEALAAMERLGLPVRERAREDASPRELVGRANPALSAIRALAGGLRDRGDHATGREVERARFECFKALEAGDLRTAGEWLETLRAAAVAIQRPDATADALAAAVERLARAIGVTAGRTGCMVCGAPSQVHRSERVDGRVVTVAHLCPEHATAEERAALERGEELARAAREAGDLPARGGA